MSKKKDKKQPEAAKSITPEQVILSRLRRLASGEEIRSFFFKLIMMVLLLWVLFGVLFGITPMRNNDMSPRISAGDLLLYYRLSEDYGMGDVIVFEKDGMQYVGRIVAKEGDSVEITDEQLKVNGSVVMESDIFYITRPYEGGVTYPVNLGTGQYFVLCDFREGARDSRYFGAVSRNEIKGEVITVLRRSSL